MGIIDKTPLPVIRSYVIFGNLLTVAYVLIQLLIFIWESMQFKEILSKNNAKDFASVLH